MYKRGNWSVLGVKKNDKLLEAIGQPRMMLELSALVALVSCKMKEITTSGINPFAQPRLDETIYAVTSDSTDEPSVFLENLYHYAKDTPADRAIADIDPYLPFVGLSESDYSLGDEKFAFWYVINQWKDSNDAASFKEKLCYERFERPYAFISGDDKKRIDAEASSQTAILRRQFPVFIDFRAGLIFAETTAGPEIEILLDTFKTIGLEIEGRHWEFDNDPLWMFKFLNFAAENTKYKEEFTKRAEELTMFSKGNIAKLENKAMEAIVSNYYSLAELPNALWAGLKAPAQFRLHPASDTPIGATTPSNAWTVLNFTDDAQVFASGVVIQELYTRINKADQSEKIIRKDIFTLTIDPSINNLDLGVAFLKGFDLPKIKTEINREVKKTKTNLAISQYWMRWLQEMEEAVLTFISCVRDTLELSGSAKAGILPMDLDDDKSGTFVMGTDVSSVSDSPAVVFIDKKTA
jgi:hypothetical protein